MAIVTVQDALERPFLLGFIGLGRYQILGTAQKLSIPGQYLVGLYSVRTRRRIAATASDPETGSFSFTFLPQKWHGDDYWLAAFDADKTQNPAVSDFVAAELME